MRKHKTIVFGMGRSGISALKLLDHLGYETLAINGPALETWVTEEIKSLSKLQMTEQDFLSFNAQDYLSMVLSPGIPRTHPVVKKILDQGGEVISEIELGYRYWNGQIMALTGTNGKTTTVSLLDSIFRHADVKVFTGGNIGIPFCDGVLAQLKGADYDLALLELSSFQLESMDTFRPHIAGILNITMSHAERYPSIEPYREAKFHLMDNMESGDVLVCDSKLASDLPQGDYNLTLIDDQNTHSKLLNELQLPGMHNVLNLIFAESMAAHYGLTVDEMREGVRNFRGVTHRLERVEVDQVVYNDSKSTNWVATLTALKAVDKPIQLILGGQLRMKDSTGFIDEVLTEIKSKVEKLWLYGEAGDLLAKDFAEFNFEQFKSLDELVPKALTKAKGAHLVFSPGFPSFDQYKNFEERGEKFKELVQRNC